jgi:hypothetical protein
MDSPALASRNKANRATWSTSRRGSLAFDEARQAGQRGRSEQTGSNPREYRQGQRRHESIHQGDADESAKPHDVGGDRALSP